MEKIIISFAVATQLHNLGIVIPATFAYDSKGKHCEANSPNAVYNAPSLTEMQEYANEEGVTGVVSFGNKFVGVYNGTRGNARCNTRQDAYAMAIITQKEVEAILAKFEKDLVEGLSVFGWTTTPMGRSDSVFSVNSVSGTCYYTVEYTKSNHGYKILDYDSKNLLQSGSADTMTMGIRKFLKEYALLVPVGESLNEMDFDSFSYDKFVKGLSPAFIGNLDIDAIDLGITSFYASLEYGKLLNIHTSHSYYAIQTPDNKDFVISVEVHGYEKKYPVGTAKRFICSAYSLANIMNRLKAFSDKGFRWSIENFSEVDALGYMLRDGLIYSAKIVKKHFENLGSFRNPADAYLAVYAYFLPNK